MLLSWQERLIVFNVFSPNKNYKETAEYIKKENPKHVALLEITPQWEGGSCPRVRIFSRDDGDT